MNIDYFLQRMYSEEYDFLRTNPRLGKRVILLGLGGSHAYGTSNENSDIDFRGITLNLPSDILGLTEFEQYEDNNTDTVIYSFKKIVKLLLECNPNTIELLGLEEEQYLIKSELGEALLEQKSMFLSKRAAKSFGGYASAQLRRLQNAIAQDSMPQKEREQHIYNSVKNALEDFRSRNAVLQKGKIDIYIDEAENPEFETELFVDAEYQHLPLRDYKNTIDDLPLLLSIRRGEFQKEDKTFSKEFYDILADYEKRLEIASKNTKLPDHPDMERVEKFVEYVNRRAIEGEYDERY